MSEPTIAQLMSLLTEMQTKINGLETELAQTRKQAQPVQLEQEKSTSRRRMLKKLGAGMLVVGVAASAGLASQTQSAQALVKDNPHMNIGTIIGLNTAYIGGIGFPSNRYLGLLATTEANINLGAIPGSENAAVLGYSNTTNATGVYGYSSNTYGVFGESSTGEGVHAKSYGSFALAAESIESYGVLAKSTNSHAIVAEANSSSGYGVWAKSPGIGVYATSNSQNAVYGETNNGIAIYGKTNSTNANGGQAGVMGIGTDAHGVRGASTTKLGVQGISSSGHGVRGMSTSGYGVYATSESNNGAVIGSTSGAPLRIIPGAQPTTGTRQVGEMYLSPQGNLYVYTSTGWVKVQYIVES